MPQKNLSKIVTGKYKWNFGGNRENLVTLKVNQVGVSSTLSSNQQFCKIFQSKHILTIVILI